MSTGSPKTGSPNLVSLTLVAPMSQKFQSSRGGRTAARFFFANGCEAPAARHSPAAPARHSLQPAHRGRDSDFALPPRSELRLRFFAEKPITGPAPKVREICCPRSITPGVFFPSPGQRRRSASDAVLAVSLTECFFTTHTLPSILAWAQDCPTQSWRGHRIATLNPGVATGLLPPILR